MCIWWTVCVDKSKDKRAVVTRELLNSSTTNHVIDRVRPPQTLVSPFEAASSKPIIRQQHRLVYMRIHSRKLIRLVSVNSSQNERKLKLKYADHLPNSVKYK